MAIEWFMSNRPKYPNNYWNLRGFTEFGTVAWSLNVLGREGFNCEGGIPAGEYDSYLDLTLVARSARTVNFRIQLSTIPGEYRWFRIADGGTSKFSLGFDASQHVVLKSGTGTTWGTSTFVVPYGSSPYYPVLVEVRYNLHATEGFVYVKLNSSLEIVYEGDTTDGGSTDSDTIRWGTLNTANQSAYADVVIADTTGVEWNGWLGDLRVDGYLLESNGTVAELSRADPGVDYYQNVYGSGSSDTAFLYATADGQESTFVPEATSHSSLQWIAVQAVVIAESVDPMPSSVRTILYDGGAEYGTSTEVGTDKMPITTIYTQNPFTASEWTSDDIDALEVGVEIQLP